MGEDTPRFQHDCDQCIFLGPYKQYDLYICPAQTLGPSMIARYGDEGGNYQSGPVVCFERMLTDGLGVSGDPTKHIEPTDPYILEHPLLQARQRAIDRGFYKDRRKIRRYTYTE